MTTTSVEEAASTATGLAEAILAADKQLVGLTLAAALTDTALTRKRNQALLSETFDGKNAELRAAQLEARLLEDEEYRAIEKEAMKARYDLASARAERDALERSFKIWLALLRAREDK